MIYYITKWKSKYVDKDNLFDSIDNMYFNTEALQEKSFCIFM